MKSDAIEEIVSDIYEHAFMAGVCNERDDNTGLEHNIKKAGQAKQALKALIAKAEREARDEPVMIMGKTIDEVCQILSALELERTEDMKMTMDNLNEWMVRVREDHHKAMQRAMDKTFDDLATLTKKEKCILGHDHSKLAKEEVCICKALTKEEK